VPARRRRKEHGHAGVQGTGQYARAGAHLLCCLPEDCPLDSRTLPALKDTLLPAAADDVLELDELWSFVLKKSRKRWLWTAICRRTRQIVALVIGDRSQKTCRRLWDKVPDEYKQCLTFSDFWEAYQQVFPKKTLRCVGKASGETAHMERWYNTLRQRLARFVRKTLSFSKSDAFHHMVTTWFIAEYNLAISLTM